jgi:hypothetical protein
MVTVSARARRRDSGGRGDHSPGAAHVAALKFLSHLSQILQQTLPELRVTPVGSQNYNVITGYEQDRS